MNDNGQPSSVFDELIATGAAPPDPGPPPTRAGAVPDRADDHPSTAAAASSEGGDEAQTPARIKQAVQELLRLGVLYKTSKPHLYDVVLTNRPEVSTILEPLDLTVRLDEVRGLAILTVAPAPGGPDGPVGPNRSATADEWNHPLVRRQRLTLAQSLLVALLRRHYVDHEKAGSSLTPPRVAIEDLVPELQPYLGDEGTDAGEHSRVRRLLEQLKDAGIVSPVGEDDTVTIRPLICHLADPASLQTLLHHYEALAAEHAGGRPQ